MKVRDRVCIEEDWVNGTIVEINGDQLWIETDVLKNGRWQLAECHKDDVVPLKTYKMCVSMRAFYEFELEAINENEAMAMLQFTDLDEDEIVKWDEYEIESVTEEK